MHIYTSENAGHVVMKFSSAPCFQSMVTVSSFETGNNHQWILQDWSVSVEQRCYVLTFIVNVLLLLFNFLSLKRGVIMGMTYIFVDKDYVRWLSLYYPDALPDDLRYDSTPPTPSGNFGSDVYQS